MSYQQSGVGGQSECERFANPVQLVGETPCAGYHGRQRGGRRGVVLGVDRLSVSLLLLLYQPRGRLDGVGRERGQVVIVVIMAAVTAVRALVAATVAVVAGAAAAVAAAAVAVAAAAVHRRPAGRFGPAQQFLVEPLQSHVLHPVLRLGPQTLAEPHVRVHVVFYFHSFPGE